MKKSIVYIISKLDVSLGFVDLFDKLKSGGVDFKVILINPKETTLYVKLKDKGVIVEEYYYHGKKDILKLILKVYIFLKKERPDIIHTHLLDAGFIGGVSGWLARISFRIYTRHHSDAHFFENKKGRLYDKMIHSFYHKIIALSSGHLKLLREKEHLGNKLVLIPNFFDEKIFLVSEDRKELMKNKYGFLNTNINIGVNARWTELKGIHYIIDAVEDLLLKNENIKLYLFNATGDFSEVISKKLNGLPSSSYQSIKFESDMMAVYPHFNYFIHVPIRETAESFGLVYIEALGSGLPCIFTLSGIACDEVVHKKNAFVVPFESSLGIKKALQELISNKELRDSISSNNKDIISKYSLSSHVDELLKLYNIKNEL